MGRVFSEGASVPSLLTRGMFMPEAVAMKRSPVLGPGRMKLAEYDRQEWIVDLEYGVTRQDVLRQDFWAHYAQMMKPYDHIECRSADDTWVSFLRVIAVERTSAKVFEMHFYSLEAPKLAPVDRLHEVQWKGPTHRHSVIRLADQTMVKSGFQSKEDAETWMAEHEKAITP